jgi:TonB family protein
MKLRLALSCIASLTILTSPFAAETKQSVCLCKFTTPPYSVVARTARIQGIVRVKLDLNSEGIPQDISVLETSHEILSGDVVRTLKNWQFCPSSAKRTEIVMTFQFKLDGTTADWSPTLVSFDPSGEMDITTAAVKPEKHF